MDQPASYVDWLTSKTPNSGGMDPYRTRGDDYLPWEIKNAESGSKHRPMKDLKLWVGLSQNDPACFGSRWHLSQGLGFSEFQTFYNMLCIRCWGMRQGGGGPSLSDIWEWISPSYRLNLFSSFKHTECPRQHLLNSMRLFVGLFWVKNITSGFICLSYQLHGNF